jgi:hypothetical protein
MNRHGLALTLVNLAMCAATGAAIAIGDAPADTAPTRHGAAALGAHWAQVIAGHFDRSLRPGDVMTVEITDCEPLESAEPAATRPVLTRSEPQIPARKGETP